VSRGFLISVKCTYKNVYIISIYGFNLRSTMKSNKWSKETTFIQKPCDMLQALAKKFYFMKSEGQFQLTHLALIFDHQPNQNDRLGWRHKSSLNGLLEQPVQFQGVKTLAVHCHFLCSAAGEHSAGCRTSRVCLQHHATVVTSNGVTICGSQFPFSVSKHCQHQHSAIPKTRKH
jgi:hypothetical protein